VQNGWRALSGLPEDPFRLDGQYRGWQSDAHYAMFPTANGKVLLAGPMVDMAWLDTQGNGGWTAAGARGDDAPSFAGNWVMYAAGRILKTGGATWNNNAPANANSYVIDTTRGGAEVRRVASMAYPRVQANGVALPNGQVVVVGGQTYAKEFSDDYAVLAPELWDPETETFTVLPAMGIARNYHGVALLMPDGRVASAGGGLCNCAADHPDMQILSPPYLFNPDGSAATRPVITTAPLTLSYGSTVNVATDSAVTSFALVRMGAATHTVNNDQRRVALEFTRSAGNGYQLSIPSNPGILIPGQWMLFAMNEQGTPSLAKIVVVSNAGAPVLRNPGNVAVGVGQPASVAIGATSATGTLFYSATGLPAGLSINSATGVISGTAQVAGSSVVTIYASNGAQTVSTDVVVSAAVVGSGRGLLGQYFATAVPSGAAALQRTEALDFDWGANAPANGLPADNFSVRWTGSIETPVSGAVQLRTVSDDGIRVWVDNKLVIDNWTGHAPVADTATLNLQAGQRYPITVEYFEGGGGATLRLQWQLPGTPAFTAVPADRLYAGTVPSTTNLAPGKPATQSSTYEAAVASRAVDGNTLGTYGGGSLTHTASNTAQDWWQVDLGRSNRIDSLTLWNRTDCCADRLSNFVVFVSATDMAGRSLDQLRADPAVASRQVGASNIASTIGIPVGANGRFVRVQLKGQGYLSLAEVQVFGAPILSYRTPQIDTIAAQQTLAGAAVGLVARGSDPDGNTLSFKATGLPPGVSISAATGVLNGAPTTAGLYDVTIGVVNDGGFEATTRFAWTVLGPIPSVSVFPTPIAARGTTVTYAPVLGAGAASQVGWDFGDGTGTAYTANAGTTHVYAAPGVYTVTMTVRTDDGRSSTQRFVQAVSADGTASGVAAARASGPLLLEPRNGGSRLWVVNGDNDTVSVFNAANNARLTEIAVGGDPRSVALAADGRIWVTNKRGASISIIDPTGLGVAQTVALPRASQPHGLVISPLDGSAFVVLEATGQLLKLNGTSGATIGILNVGDNPRHLAIAGAGDRLLVSRFITRPLPGEGTAKVRTVDAQGANVGGEVLVVDPAAMALRRTLVLAHSERVDAENQGRGIPNYLGAPAISPDGRTAWVPSKQDNVLRGASRDGKALDFQNTVRSISSRIDLGTLAEDLAGRVDHDNSSLASAALYHPSGAYVFVAQETARQVAVLDAAGRRELFRFEVGIAPQGLALSADGLRLYVHNFMDRSVSAIDLTPLVRFGQVGAAPTAVLASVGTEKLAAAVLRGKQLFYDARDPRLSRDSYMSCASCHSEGGHDGRTWDLSSLGEGLRNTIALKGRAGTGQGLLHWSGNFDEVHDFEGQIRALAGGSGLMADTAFATGTRSQPLGDPKAGLSADLDALAAYLGSLNTFAPSPWRAGDGGLSAAAQLGRTVFVNANCASCHGGTAFTNSGDATQLKNIGTLKAGSGKRLGGALTGIDIPTLRDVWATGPYLHDGSAATLDAAVTAHDNVALNASDLANVVAYLGQIGSDEAVAPALVASSATFGPTGGGTAFADAVAPGQRLTGVVVRAGWWIDSIQGLATPANLPVHGGNGGGVYTATWPANEYLVRVSGQWGSGGVIGKISFITNTGRVLGPFGIAKEIGTLTSFDYAVPAGNRILGFTGRSGASLNALGVIHGP
jgi:YVTN family beta-propeller protein